MHLLRRALGLPYKSGYYYDHPRASPERGDGTFTVDNGNVMFTPEPKDGSRRLPPAEHVLSSVKSGKVNCDSSRFPEFAGLDERPKFQGGVVHTADRQIFKETFAAEGDEGALSVSLAEDVWYLLTEELSIWAVLRLEIALEVLLIVGFALALTVVPAAELLARAAQLAAKERLAAVLILPVPSWRSSCYTMTSRPLPAAAGSARSPAPLAGACASVLQVRETRPACAATPTASPTVARTACACACACAWRKYDTDMDMESK